jgi:putative oxidoreductase
MNRLSPYGALLLRLAVGGVLLHHGLAKLHDGLPALREFLRGAGVLFPTIGAVVVLAVETVGALCVILGVFTRFWAACAAVEMIVAIVAVKLPTHRNIDLEALLLAGATALVAWGDGPFSLGIGLKRRD